MKRILIAASFPLVLMACNNNATNHNGHADTTTSHHHGPMTDSSQGMMQLMHTMMSDMEKIPSAKDADKDFAALMKAHHKGAVDMAQLYLQQGSDQSLKDMANNIIRDQQKEIQAFDSFLVAERKPSGDSSYYQQSMKMMREMPMDMSNTGTIDYQFVTMMIPHHQAGIDMAKAYLKQGKDATLRQIAEGIIPSQQKEIDQMNNWLKQNKTTTL